MADRSSIEPLQILRNQELIAKRAEFGGRSDCKVFDPTTWETFFAYPTSRVVYIRYRWLGLGKILLDFAVLGYLCYIIFLDRRLHARKGSPQVYSFFTPLPINQTDHPSDYPSCAPTYNTYLQTIVENQDPEKYPCVRILKEHMFTDVNTDRATIVTHTQSWRYRKKNDGSTQTTSTNEYYTLGVENLSFEFAFVFQCPTLYSPAITSNYYNTWQQSSDSMKGYLCRKGFNRKDCASNENSAQIKPFEVGNKTIQVKDLIAASQENSNDDVFDFLDKPCPEQTKYDSAFDNINNIDSLGIKLNSQNANSYKLRRCGVIFEMTIEFEQRSKFLDWTGLFNPTEFTFYLYIDHIEDQFTYSVETTAINNANGIPIDPSVVQAYDDLGKSSTSSTDARYIPSSPSVTPTVYDATTKVSDSEIQKLSTDEVYLRYIKRGITIRTHGGQGLRSFFLYFLCLCVVSLFVLKTLSNFIVDTIMTHFIWTYSPLFYRAKYEFSADINDLKQEDMDMKEIVLKSKENQLGQARKAIKAKMSQIQRKANDWRKKCMYLFDDVNEVFRVTKYRNPETIDILNQLTQNIIEGWSKVKDDIHLEEEFENLDPEEQLRVETILRIDTVRFKNVPPPPQEFRTIVFVPSVSMRWNLKAQNFATEVLKEYKPQRFRYVQILGVGKRRDVKAAEVECDMTLDHMTLDNIRRSIEMFEEDYPLASKFHIRPCMDVLITELKKFVDKVDPHCKGFVLQNNFRELMTLTSQMNIKKMDHFYRLLKNQKTGSKKNPGVSLNQIVKKAYQRGLKVNRSNPTEAINWAVRELAKEALERKRSRGVYRTGSEHEM